MPRIPLNLPESPPLERPSHATTSDPRPWWEKSSELIPSNVRLIKGEWIQRDPNAPRWRVVVPEPHHPGQFRVPATDLYGGAWFGDDFAAQYAAITADVCEPPHLVDRKCLDALDRDLLALEREKPALCAALRKLLDQPEREDRHPGDLFHPGYFAIQRRAAQFVNPSEVLDRHLSGDFGEISQAADASIDDEARFCPPKAAWLQRNLLAIEAGRGLVRSEYVRIISAGREMVRVVLVTLLASPSPSKTALVFVERTPAPFKDPDRKH